MTIQQQILNTIKKVDDPSLLNTIYDYVCLLEMQNIAFFSNKNKVLHFFNIISDEEAQQMQHCIDSEFNHIEGEW